MNSNLVLTKHDQAIQIVSSFFDLMEAMKIDQWIQLWAEDGVHHMPYAPPGFPNRVEGKKAIYSHFSVIPNRWKSIAFVNRRIYPMLSPDRVVAEYRGETEISEGRSYNNDYCSFFQLQENQLISVTEYFNPLVLTQSFGDNLPKA